MDADPEIIERLEKLEEKVDVKDYDYPQIGKVMGMCSRHIRKIRL